MSKIGKQIVDIPQGTEVKLVDGVLSVKGPEGAFSKNFRDNIKIQINENKITFVPVKNDIFSRSLWGTYASHVKNMIAGVNKEFEKKLIIEGVGFKSEVTGEDLVLALGFSHPVKVPIPADLKVTAVKNNISIIGIDKERVGEFAAKLRSLKKPEPYKGKGIRYQEEIIRRKQGKKTV